MVTLKANSKQEKVNVTPSASNSLYSTVKILTLHVLGLAEFLFISTGLI